jgi:hypothetical protein
MIFSYPFYTVILAYVPRHVSRNFYNLELGMATAGRRT